MPRDEWHNDAFENSTQPLDYSAQSGAIDAADAAYDADSLQYNTISSSATTFDPTDATDTAKFQSLKDHNDDQYTNEYQTQRRSKHRLFDLRHYCESLDLPPHVMGDCYNRFEEVDFNAFGSYDAEAVLLSLISLVANEHDIAVRDSSPLTKEDRATVYQNIRDTTRTSKKDIRKVRQLLRDEDY